MGADDDPVTDPGALSDYRIGVERHTFSEDGAAADLSGGVNRRLYMLRGIEPVEQREDCRGRFCDHDACGHSGGGVGQLRGDKHDAR
jgi:hypothetical protein